MSSTEINFLEEMANFTFVSKYARYDEKKKRRETWEETVARVEQMHLKKFKNLSKEDKAEIKKAFDIVREKKVVPSLRSLQFGGKAIEAHQARIYNCAVKHIDSLRSFAESFYVLLCGTGIGFGLSNRFLGRLPDLVNAKDKTGTVVSYIVQDNIEGWSDSVEALLMCYFKNTPYTGRKIVFDYSRIRPKGAKLKTGGGKAPGYKGLKNCHSKIKLLLDTIIEDKGQVRLKTINAYDILMHCADAVLSGGIRRSACSVIFDFEDEEMMNAKTGNWFNENPQRARSNNSAMILRGTLGLEQFKEIIQRTREFGEPGFVFGENKDQLLNPCFTIDTKILTEHGWRSFEDLVGKSVNIIQDNRVKGELIDKQEKWKINESNVGTAINWASNIRRTAINQEVFLLTSKCGRQVKATANHSFATPKGMIELKDLKKGDRIFAGVPDLYKPDKQSEEFEKGFVAGLVYGDGNEELDRINVDIWESHDKEINIERIEKLVQKVANAELVNQIRWKKEPEFSKCLETEVFTKYRLSSSALKRTFNKFNFTKSNLDWLHKTSKDFKAGFLSGFFYADGHTEFNDYSRSISFRFTSINFQHLQDIQLILQELGIFAKICDLKPEGQTLLPDGRGGKKLYSCKKSFRIIVGGRENCCHFERLTRFIDIYKYKKFDSVINDIKKVNVPYKNQIKVKSIEKIGQQDVYCLSEDVNRTLIAEGFSARRCYEVSFLPVTDDGRTGYQYCNLSSINGAKVKSKDDFCQASWAAALIGTLQASYTTFPYLGHVSEQLCKEEALLGVSITGMMDNPDILFDPQNQKDAAKIAVDTNREWAKKIGINQAARITVVKPEGSSSIVLSSASGIHPHHSRKYFRRIQMNKEDNIFKFFKMHNPHACEESVWSANKTDEVVTFPIEISEKSIIKKDLTAIKHLELIKSTQLNWVNSGTTEANKKPINHSVSCTVIVKDDEWDEVTKYLYENQGLFTAVSLLPYSGDKIYKQAPMEDVVSQEDSEKFETLKKLWEKVDYTKLEEIDDETSHTQEVACGGGNCEIV